MKKNCWEFKNCGRQPGGERVEDLGICSATREKKLDGIHGGKNAGRACWIVAGTFCKGEVQGFFAQKFKGCKECEFYQLVKNEEGTEFILSATLLNKLKDNK
ncbi:MAG: hypothetical protein HY755_08105 [Nitrospirae bacterium]|nr:hypothetical protein [Nitrospirota bacterium]